MSNCKTRSQEISWDPKKREVLKIRGPLNIDGTVRFCYKEQEATIGIVTGGGSNQMVAVEKKPVIDERPPATPTTQDTPKTTEDLLTRIAIALEGVAASLKLRAVLSNDPRYSR
jgi:erythromycin esterase-like protein